MSIYVVRHGQTLFNKLGKNQGWIDSDLTKEGIEVLQSNFSKVNFPYFEAVYCSDLGRAKGTLSILFDYIQYNEEQIYYTRDLRERFLGSFEGDVLLDNRNKLAEKEGYSDFDHFIKENSFWKLVDLTKKYDERSLAEDFSEFSTRINHFVDSIANKHMKKDILIVAHANPIKYMLEYLTEKESKIVIDNGSILKFDNLNEKWLVEKII